MRQQAMDDDERLCIHSQDAGNATNGTFQVLVGDLGDDGLEVVLCADERLATFVCDPRVLSHVWYGDSELRILLKQLL